MCINNLSKVRSATAKRLFIGVAVKLHRLVFALGTLYFGLLYFRYVFGHRIAVFILVTRA